MRAGATNNAGDDGRFGPRERVSLTQLAPGQSGTVCGTSLSPGDRRLLSAMGLRDHAKVVLCRLGEPCIVRVMGGCNCSSRIGLARPLAERVFVTPTDSEASGSGPTADRGA